MSSAEAVPPVEGEVVEVAIHGIAGGGEAVGRAPDGRALFVAGALPGEWVQVAITEVRRRHARGELVEVLDPAPERRAPSCPHVADGCGGCDWQHIDDDAQRGLRRTIVADALARIGRLDDPRVEAGPALAARGSRTTVRALVDGGRAGFRRRRSRDPVLVDSCLVTHPAAEELLVEGRFGSAEEVVARVGARTGERMVVAWPTADGVEVPDDVRVVGADELDAGVEAWIHEELAGRSWRVSARSFLQASPEAADALVERVAVAVAELSPDAVRLVDLCAGIGLFAGTVGRSMGQVVAVESSSSAVADARHNLADIPAQVVRSTMARWRPDPTDVVVADPPRTGLGPDGVAPISASGAHAVVLISCDAGSLGRDARLLAEAGFAFDGCEVLDPFPQTSHVEVVSRFHRS